MDNNTLKGIAIIAVAIPFLIVTIILIKDSFKHGGGAILIEEKADFFNSWFGE